MDYRKLLLSSCLRLLGTVLGTGLVSLGNTLSIECTSDDVITYTGEVLNSSASDKNNRVLLEVVSDTGNLSCYFVSVCKLNSGDLSHSGVRLLRCSGSYSGANASLLR